jgi:heme/copper-type cytochrome/quinol oxidase subunit 4
MYQTIYKIGYRSGFIAFGATVAFVIVQLLQLAHVFSSPLDETLIYATSLCIVIPFVLEILALYHVTPNDKKFWSHAALVFTILYGVFVTSNYVVQLATVIPMKLNGTAGEIHVLEQTPHSMFWDFDALGYIFMGLATCIAIPVFENQGFQKWVRISFIANALATPLIAFVYFYPGFSEKLLLLGFPWGITAPLAMLMLAIFFKRNLTETEQNKIK